MCVPIQCRGRFRYDPKDEIKTLESVRCRTTFHFYSRGEENGGRAREERKRIGERELEREGEGGVCHHHFESGDLPQGLRWPQASSGTEAAGGGVVSLEGAGMEGVVSRAPPPPPPRGTCAHYIGAPTHARITNVYVQFATAVLPPPPLFSRLLSLRRRTRLFLSKLWRRGLSRSATLDGATAAMSRQNHIFLSVLYRQPCLDSAVGLCCWTSPGLAKGTGLGAHSGVPLPLCLSPCQPCLCPQAPGGLRSSSPRPCMRRSVTARCGRSRQGLVAQVGVGPPCRPICRTLSPGPNTGLIP